MPLPGGTPPMETQSALMAAAAAAVLLVAIFRVRRDSPALLFGTLTAAFGVWCLARGAGALGWAAGPLAAGLSLAVLGGLAPTVAAALTGVGVRPRLVRTALWLGPPAVAGRPGNCWARMGLRTKLMARAMAKRARTFT